MDQLLTLLALLSGSTETQIWSLWCPPVGPATDLARLVVWFYGDPELEPSAHPLDQLLTLPALLSGSTVTLIWSLVPTCWTSY